MYILSYCLDLDCTISKEREKLWIMAGMYDLSLTPTEEDTRVMKRYPSIWRIDPKFCTRAGLEETKATFNPSESSGQLLQQVLANHFPVNASMLP